MKLCALLLALCTALALPGCGNPPPALPEQLPAEGFAVGIIRTSGSQDRSDIFYLGGELEQVGQLSVPYAGMGGLFYAPVVAEGALYVVPQGQANRKDLGLLLRQDLDDFSTRTFSLDQTAIYGLSADGQAIYALSNLNTVSYVSRVDQADGSVRTAEYPDTYVSVSCLFGGTLYVFAEQSGGAGLRSTLYRLDPDTLELLGETDLTGLGAGVYSAAGAGEYLYFAPMTTSQDAPNHVLGRWHIPTGTLDAVDCGAAVYQLALGDGRLYLSHGDVVTGAGTALSVYDLETGGLEAYDLGLWPAQLAVNGGALYVLSGDRAAKFDADTLERLAEAPIPLEEGQYLSGLFAAPPG